MTLLDFPGHVACTVFLGGCDLRCPFCHNYELATGQVPPVMEEDELFAFLAKRTGTPNPSAVRQAIPIPDASMVSILVTPESPKRRQNSLLHG